VELLFLGFIFLLFMAVCHTIVIFHSYSYKDILAAKGDSRLNQLAFNTFERGEFVIDYIHGSIPGYDGGYAEYADPAYLGNIAKSLGFQVKELRYKEAITELDLANASVLVEFVPQTPYMSDEEIELILKFVEKGGGLYIVPYYEFYCYGWFEEYPNPYYNLLYEFFGFKITGELKSVAFVVNVSSEHPIFKGVEMIEVFRGGCCKLSYVQPPSSPLIVIDGNALFLAGSYGNGRIFVDLTNMGIGYLKKYDNQILVRNAILWVSANSPNSAKFDFRLKIVPSTHFVEAGRTVSFNTTVELISGPPQLVTLNVVELPNGFSCSFKPNSQKPPFISQLSITTSLTTPTGAYNITIYGQGGEITRYINVTLIVFPPQPRFLIIQNTALSPDKKVLYFELHWHFLVLPYEETTYPPFKDAKMTVEAPAGTRLQIFEPVLALSTWSQVSTEIGGALFDALGEVVDTITPIPISTILDLTEHAARIQEAFQNSREKTILAFQEYMGKASFFTELVYIVQIRSETDRDTWPIRLKASAVHMNGPNTPGEALIQNEIVVITSAGISKTESAFAMEIYTKVNVDEKKFPLIIISNSTISNLNFSPEQKKLSYTVEGPAGTEGFSNITIPKDLLNANPTEWNVLIDGSKPNSIEITWNNTHTFIYFTYTHSTHLVEIEGTMAVPEFNTITTVLAFMTFAALALIVKDRAPTKTLNTSPST